MSATIVIVEDNADLREMLACFLRMYGYTVKQAEDGLEGLRMIRQQPPDLIITDIEMPNMDGMIMIKELRRRPETSRVPVLVLTAYDANMGNKAIEAGATRAAYKPIQLEILIRMIEQLL